MIDNTESNFWFEINEFIGEDDVDFCKFISTKFSNSTVVLSDKLPVFQNFFFKDAEDDYSEHHVFKRIADLLKYTKKHWDYKYVFGRSHVSKITGSLAPHVDFRSCVISIPVNKIEYPLHWYDDEHTKNLIATYHYNQAVLINTHTAHGCPENNKDRILFQIGGFGTDEPFSVVKDAIIKRMLECKESEGT